MHEQDIDNPHFKKRLGDIRFEILKRGESVDIKVSHRDHPTGFDNGLHTIESLTAFRKALLALGRVECKEDGEGILLLEGQNDYD